MKPRSLQASIIALIFFLCSCGAAYKDVPYYQNLDHSRHTEEDITNYSPLKIQAGDLLGINVNSVPNPEAAAVFNTSISRVNGNSSETSANNPVYGFRVNANGEVQLPYVGTMRVAGMTTDEIAKQLTINLVQFLKDPIVNVRILNFKISVLGDVLRPDVYTVQNEHININEALSLAGDLNITAKRKTVLLVREQNGKRQYVNIDLTSKDLFESPYYYLRNNDILYIEPDKTKYDAVDHGYRNATLIVSLISAIATVVVSVILIKNH